MAEAIIFVDSEFGGLHTHLFQSVVDFTKLSVGGSHISGLSDNWNDKVSSIVIVSGRWQFFKDTGFSGAQGPVLGPGLYPVLPKGIDNDSISSAQVVE
jgi:Beta/Gamma crystallin